MQSKQYDSLLADKAETAQNTEQKVTLKRPILSDAVAQTDDRPWLEFIQVHLNEEQQVFSHRSHPSISHRSRVPQSNTTPIVFDNFSREE